MKYSSAPARKSQSLCANPLNRTGKPCYNRRCACLDCRNKSSWREYLVLVRSLARLPATHLIALNPPWHYHGGDVTQKVNQFFKYLTKAVGSEMVWHWRYDGQVKGRFPHLHVLVRSTGAITSEAVYEAWVKVWPGDEIEAKDTHVRECDEDYVETARYFTKHNEPTQRVPKSVWSGRLSGGSRKFFVSTRKVLFADDHYREAEEREWCALQSRYDEEYSRYYAAREVAVIPAEGEVQADEDKGLPRPVPYTLSLPRPVLYPSRLLSRVPVVLVSPPFGKRNSLYPVWPIPPPGVFGGWGRGE